MFIVVSVFMYEGRPTIEPLTPPIEEKLAEATLKTLNASLAALIIGANELDISCTAVLRELHCLLLLVNGDENIKAVQVRIDKHNAQKKEQLAYLRAKYSTHEYITYTMLEIPE